MMGPREEDLQLQLLLHHHQQQHQHHHHHLSAVYPHVYTTHGSHCSDCIIVEHPCLFMSSQPSTSADDVPMDLSMKKEDVEWREMEEFVASLKRHRAALGLTQGDVGAAMGRLFGNDFSQTTVSRFEAMNLSYRNMCKLRPLLQTWLDDALGRPASAASSTPGSSSGAGSPIHSIGKRRKKRTSFDLGVKAVLENAFKTNPKPTVEQITQLAVQLNMDREVVRVWFCNRRQKEKRSNSALPQAPPGIFNQQHWQPPPSRHHQDRQGSM